MSRICWLGRRKPSRCSVTTTSFGPGPDPPLAVDADLRPEGKQGPLVRILGSYAEYYRRWSSVWETQALLRARPVAGDPGLGAQFIALVDPIRYPAGGIDAVSVKEI